MVLVRCEYADGELWVASDCRQLCRDKWERFEDDPIVTHWTPIPVGLLTRLSSQSETKEQQ